MKLSICTTTQNRRFQKALRRSHPEIDELKRRFENVVIDDCPHEILLLAFVDEDSESCTIVPCKQDIFHFEVGYPFQEDYPPEDDVLVIQLVEEQLSRAIRACEALGPAQDTLLSLVENWTTEIVTP